MLPALTRLGEHIVGVGRAPIPSMLRMLPALGRGDGRGIGGLHEVLQVRGELERPLAAAAGRRSHPPKSLEPLELSTRPGLRLRIIVS